jgi:hypothetical protein
MTGRAFVTAFLFFMGAFFLMAVLFNLYPPAGNSLWTLAGLLVYAGIALWVTRKVVRSGNSR